MRYKCVIIATMFIFADHSQSAVAKEKQSYLITGIELKTLIKGSRIFWSRASPRGEAWYLPDGNYRFVSDNPLGQQSKYEIRRDRVCIMEEKEPLCTQYARVGFKRYKQISLYETPNVEREVFIEKLHSGR